MYCYKNFTITKLLLTVILVDRPLLFVIKVGIAAVLREESVGQCPSGSVKPLTVTVFTFLEPNIDVHTTTVRVDKFQISHVTPHLKRVDATCDQLNVSIINRELHNSIFKTVSLSFKKSYLELLGASDFDY